MNIDANIIDQIPAYSIEVGDQILIDGDPIEVTALDSTDDVDEVIVRGYSHDTGDVETYSLFADDIYDVWSI